MELPEHISIDLIKKGYDKLQLSADAHGRIAHNRAYIDNILKAGNTYYGINTGFGSLCNVRIGDRAGAAAGKPGMLSRLWYGR